MSKVREKTENSIRQLAALNPETEVWLDSSPLILNDWKKNFLKTVPDTAKREYWQGELTALYNESAPADSLLRGITTNPPLSLEVLRAQPEAYAQRIAEIKKLKHILSPRERSFLLYGDVITAGAKMFLPVFERSGQSRGYLSGQVDPRDYTDLKAMIRMGLQIKALAPNVMIKMPGTKEGIQGIEILTSLGVATNATLTFSLAQLIAVAEAVKAGLKKARENGVDLSSFKSVVTMMLGRMEDSAEFAGDAEEVGITLSSTEKRWAGLAVFKKAYSIFKKRKYESKLLAASMRLGPTVDGTEKVWHIEKLGGGDVVFTIFPNILEAYLKNYEGESVKSLIEEPVPHDVLAKLLKIEYFRKAYEEDGLKSEEFINFGPVQETEKAFNKAAEELEAFVV